MVFYVAFMLFEPMRTELEVKGDEEVSWREERHEEDGRTTVCVERKFAVTELQFSLCRE